MVNPESHSLLQLTDFHLGPTADLNYRGVNPSECLDRVLNHVQSHSPPTDRYLLTGDLAEEGVVATYDRVAKAFQGSTAPIHFLPGNHDDPEVMHACLSKAGFFGDPVISWKNWRIILLDSSQKHSPKGQLGPMTCQWLAETLESLKTCWIVIALHHHPIASGSAWMDTMLLEESEAFLDILAKHGLVKAVVFGHVHQEIDLMKNKTRFLGTPSTCVQFAPASHAFATDTSRPGYRRIDLFEDGQLTTQVLRLGPKD